MAGEAKKVCGARNVSQESINSYGGETPELEKNRRTSQ